MPYQYRNPFRAGSRYPGGFGGGPVSFSFGPITETVKYLIVINCVIFVVQLFLGQSKGSVFLEYLGPTELWNYRDFMTRWFSLPAIKVLPGGQVWRLFTYMFLHGNFSHLLFNMLTLWWFGSPVEQRLGQRRFIFFYFLCGIGAGVVCVVFYHIFGGAWAPVIGASGALMGCLAAFALLQPNAIILFMFILPMKAKWMVLFFAIMELAATASYASGGGSAGIANIAHLSGLAIGYFYLRRLGDIRAFYLRWKLKHLGAKTEKQRLKVVKSEDDHPQWLH